MNWRVLMAIVKKDLKVVAQNRSVVIPILMVPLILFGALPWLAVLVPGSINMGGSTMNDIAPLLAKLPANLTAELAPYNLEQKTVIFFLVYLLAPMFLIIPLMVSSVIAADSIAGERERRTLEALLYTPTSDRELLLGKLLSAWLAAVATAAAGFLLYSVMVNLAAWQVVGAVFFPNMMWLVMVFWVAPAAAGLGLSVMVLVSARAQGFQDAYQMGGMVVLPILLLVFGQATGVMFFSTGLVVLLGLGLWLVDAGLLWYGRRFFRREALVSRL